MQARATLMGGHRAPTALADFVAGMFASTPASAWYDPSDLSTMYQDNFAQTAVTAVEQPVGFIMDKSKGGAPRGADVVLNGGFDSGFTNWTTPNAAPGTTTLVGGRAVLDSGAGGSSGTARLRQALTVPIGWYEVTFDISAFSGLAGNAQLALGSDLSGGSQYLAISASSIGTQRKVIYVSSTTLGIAFFCGSTTTQTTFTVDNLTIKPLNGANVWVNTPVVVAATWTDNTGGSYTSTGSNGLLGWDGTAPKLTVGKTYEVTARVTARTAGSLSLPYDGAGPNNTAVASAVGSFRRVFTATVNVLYIYSNAFAGTVENIQVSEMPTLLPLTQATSTARPVLSARVNRFIATEDFTNAIWVKSGSALLTVNANAFVAPDGTQTADELVQADGGNAQSIYQQFPDTVQTGVPIVMRVRIRAGTATTASVSIYDSTAGGHTAAAATIISGPGSMAGSTLRAISGLTSDWTTLEMVLAAPVAGNVHRLMVYPNVTSAGTLGMSIGIWGAQMEQAPVASAYQRVVSATDYDWLGWPLYLRFDGTDDNMFSGGPAGTLNFNLSGTDKIAVFAGVHKSSDATTGLVAELSTDLNANNGSFFVVAPLTAGVANVSFASKGTSSVGSTGTGLPAPVSFVHSGQGDIATPRTAGRVNGASTGITSTSLGTGNYGNYPLYVGRRGTTSIPFNGRIYQLLILGRNVTPDELFLTERYVGQKMGIAL